MRVQQLLWTAGGGWQAAGGERGAGAADLVLYFAAPGTLNTESAYQGLCAALPARHRVGCSTGGEILADEVYDGSIVASAVWLGGAAVRVAVHDLGSGESSRAAGAALVTGLPREGLRAVFVLSDGTRVNGTELVAGLRTTLGDGVAITGGLAGDGADFKETRVGCDGAPQPGRLAVIAFYGDKLTVRHGSFGGWDRFGPERIITRSEANILYELDSEPALDLYKRYLGDEAACLPASALLFPLAVRPEVSDGGELVRTVVGVDENKKAMIFAGDVPQGYVAQLMRGNFDHLVDGAQRAAEQAGRPLGRGLAILVSCIGRKLLMGQRIVEEVEAVTAALGPEVATTGFYSYGEISPHGFTRKCELHNQTMTITVLSEFIP